MELQNESDPEESPIEDLAERLGVGPEELDDVWEEFTQRAVENGDFTRGSSDSPPPDDTSADLPPDAGFGDMIADEGDGTQGDLPWPSDDQEEPDTEGFPDPGIGQSAETAGSEFENTFEDFYDPDDDRLDPDGVQQVSGSDQEYVVPTSSYCERCEHFSDPPDVGCSHDGTEIVEFDDIAHVRVRNCPVVDERRELDFSG